MEFLMREASEQDLSKVMEMMQEVANDSEHKEWFMPSDEEFVKRHLQEEGFTILAESQEGKLAGFFIVVYPNEQENLGKYLDFTPEELKKVVVMDTAVVSANFRGFGLQRKMLEEAEKRIDAKTYEMAMCTVHPDNHYSLKNMEKYGYQVQKTVQCYGGRTRYVLMKKFKND